MTRRAINCVLFALVGGLTASGASLNPEQRNATFQPGGSAAIASAVVIKPAATAVPLSHWAGLKIRKITLAAQAPVKVELAGHAVAKPADAVFAPGAVRSAGGAR